MMSSYTRKLEHQLYLARANPEPVFDLSDCDLKAVPSGVYSVCKVLQKGTLLLNKNKLETLDGGGNIRDLLTIRELDLSCNRFKQLPNEFADALFRLRKLNLSGNTLLSLPSNFTALKELEELDLRDNPKLGKIPEALAACPKLSRLLIDESHPQFAFAKALQVRSELVTSIESVDGAKSNSYSMSTGAVESEITTSKMNGPDVASALARRDRERDEMRRLLVDQARVGPAFAATDYTARDRQRTALVHELAVEDERTNIEMRQLIEAKRDAHARFCANLALEQTAVHSLIDRILAANEAARRTESAAIDPVERAFYANAAADLRVRRDEVIARMRAELERSEQLTELLRRSQADTLRVVRTQTERESDAIDAALSRRDQLHAQLVRVVMEDQEVQKSMFEELQLSRDVTRRRLVEEIAQVEVQLLRLSVLDAERKQMADEMQRRALAEQRKQLVALLSELLAAKTRREAQLRELLAELEAQRSNEQVDFWLLQYQRLLDSTPESLLSKMFDLSQDIVDILFDADAQDYIPLFKRHRITMQQFLEMTDSDFKSLGIGLVGTRKSILSQIERWRSARKAKDSDYSSYAKPQMQPSAPALVEETAAKEVISGPNAVADTLRVELECCVCLDSRCDTVFLSCGHVCTCQACAEPLQFCPLCRQIVSQKLPLLFTL